MPWPVNTTKGSTKAARTTEQVAEGGANTLNVDYISQLNWVLSKGGIVKKKKHKHIIELLLLRPDVSKERFNI